jgi:chromosomal replication initiation ATPase DnaA
VNHNAWEAVLELLRKETPEEEYRRWLSATAYASDAGDQITVWVLTDAIRQHILNHYQGAIERALASLDRQESQIRFVVSGTAEDEDEDEEE